MGKTEDARVANARGEMVRFREMAHMPWCSGIRKSDWRLGGRAG
jgi:hypothetical protein